MKGLLQDSTLTVTFCLMMQMFHTAKHCTIMEKNQVGKIFDILKCHIQTLPYYTCLTKTYYLMLLHCQMAFHYFVEKVLTFPTTSEINCSTQMTVLSWSFSKHDQTVEHHSYLRVLGHPVFDVTFYHCTDNFYVLSHSYISKTFCGELWMR